MQGAGHKGEAKGWLRTMAATLGKPPYGKNQTLGRGGRWWAVQLVVPGHDRARTHLVPQAGLVGDLPGASTGMGGVHSEGAGVHHELDAAGGEVEQVHHLILAVAHETLVVPGHKLAGDDDVWLKALFVPGGVVQAAHGEVGGTHSAPCFTVLTSTTTMRGRRSTHIML